MHRAHPRSRGADLFYSPPRRDPWAHPRSRGADPPHHRSRRTTWGSSPLARGGPLNALASRVADGLIPARAGRTERIAVAVPPPRAHPRSRGADSLLERLVGIDQGSSPLARGGRPLRDGIPHRWGLIPARAGRTPADPVRHLGARAHPRSRGADSLNEVPQGLSQGSSPLARGGLKRCI